MNTNAVEQRLPHENERELTSTVVKQGLPLPDDVLVEQRLPTLNERIRELPSTVVEQGLPLLDDVLVQQRLPTHYENKRELSSTVAEQGLPLPGVSVQHKQPTLNAAVEQQLPHGNGAGKYDDLPHLEKGDSVCDTSSGSDGTTPVSSRGSRRSKTSRRSRRRLRPRRDSPEPEDEVVCALEYVEGVPHTPRMIRVSTLTRLPELSWKTFLHELKTGDIEQVCLIASEDPSAQPKSAEPKSARETRFAAQSWESLRTSGKPVYEVAR